MYPLRLPTVSPQILHSFRLRQFLHYIAQLYSHTVCTYCFMLFYSCHSLHMHTYRYTATQATTLLYCTVIQSHSMHIYIASCCSTVATPYIFNHSIISHSLRVCTYRFMLFHSCLSLHIQPLHYITQSQSMHILLHALPQWPLPTYSTTPLYRTVSEYAHTASCSSTVATPYIFNHSIISHSLRVCTYRFMLFHSGLSLHIQPLHYIAQSQSMHILPHALPQWPLPTYSTTPLYRTVSEYAHTASCSSTVASPSSTIVRLSPPSLLLSDTLTP